MKKKLFQLVIILSLFINSLFLLWQGWLFKLTFVDGVQNAFWYPDEFLTHFVWILSPLVGLYFTWKSTESVTKLRQAIIFLSIAWVGFLNVFFIFMTYAGMFPIPLVNAKFINYCNQWERREIKIDDVMIFKPWCIKSRSKYIVSFKHCDKEEIATQFADFYQRKVSELVVYDDAPTNTHFQCRLSYEGDKIKTSVYFYSD